MEHLREVDMKLNFVAVADQENSVRLGQVDVCFLSFLNAVSVRKTCLISIISYARKWCSRKAIQQKR